MQHFRNYELANIYGVSKSAVGKWIKAANDGKLDISLVYSDGKSYIARTDENRALIENIVKKRKKYFNSLGHKNLSPKEDFYKIFNNNQILDIAANLEIHHEIPRQYSYFGHGAHYWKEYQEQLENHNSPNTKAGIAATQLDMNRDYLLNNLFEKYNKISIIELGAGFVASSKEIISPILAAGKLVRYVAIDSSPERLKHAQDVIQKLFGNKVKFESVVRDITHERFYDLLICHHSEANLILSLGSMLYNLRDPEGALKTIRDSMGLSDIFVHNFKLDTITNRHYFDLRVEPSTGDLSGHHSFILDILGFDKTLYEVRLEFDEALRERHIKVVLNVSISLTLKYAHTKRCITFNKGDSILIWRYKHRKTQEIIAQLETNGFDVLQANKTIDREYLLTIAGIKDQFI